MAKDSSKKNEAKKTKKKGKRASKELNRDTREIRGLLLYAGALLLFLSLLSFAFKPSHQHWLGLAGHSVGWVFHAFFGIGSYLLCIYFGWMGWRLMFKKSLNFLPLKSLAIAILLFSTGMLLSVLETRFTQSAQALRQTFYHSIPFHLGGAPAYYLYSDLPEVNFLRAFNDLGIFLIFSTAWLGSLLFLFKASPFVAIATIYRHWQEWRERQKAERAARLKDPEPLSKNESRLVKVSMPTSASNSTEKQAPIALDPLPTRQELMAIHPERDLKVRPSLSRKGGPFLPAPEATIERIESFPAASSPPAIKEDRVSKRQKALQEQRVHNGDFTAYELPVAGLLQTPKKVDSSTLKQDLKRQAEVLEETLHSFGIEAKVGQINCGPTITSFEVHPSIGVKVQKIKALENDIALNMEAKSIRIIAPIPGKAAVGIEVPNAQPQEVSYRELLTAYQQGGKKFHIPVLLGKAVNGDFVMSDLAKMPHCIIAGATGSGKSVCINTIVMSIVMNARPDEIKLLMVDPKKVELTPYTKLPHMLAPVITEPEEACAALQWLVKEMERRYDTLKLVGVRNIEGFNNRTIDKAAEADLGKEIPDKLPYIVGIIDELADLMMVASHDIETFIARIAQMARAVGIHLILATQRPSREVITGLIKANFPTRIAFKVASRVNSQIILDETGAESLLGNGDMLFLPPGTSQLVRAQGAFVRDEEIHRVLEKITSQAPPNYLISSFNGANRLSDGEEDGEEDFPEDSLYEQALKTVVETGNASTTFLQRKLKIGYARAASLMDELEKRGVVGPADGSKPRKILALKGAANTSNGEEWEEIEDSLTASEEEHVF